ncbi:MAG: STAS domain-containing protein [Hyphomicrobiales bacterium]|nr:STAS domain-containing protein [Hyphomicrobiales bacterium]
MNYEVREEHGAVVVALEGDVDLESSPTARKVLLEAVKRKAPVFVDMSRVSYIDSSGVASLVEALQTARKAKTGFALASVSDAARRVLELARLDKVFTIHGSVLDALSQVKS